MSDLELRNVVGGAIGSTLLNSFSRLVSTVFEIGQSLGTSLRMVFSRKRC